MMGARGDGSYRLHRLIQARRVPPRFRVPLLDRYKENDMDLFKWFQILITIVVAIIRWLTLQP